MNKWTLTLLLTMSCALCTVAQVNNAGTNSKTHNGNTSVVSQQNRTSTKGNPALDNQVEQAVTRAQARTVLSNEESLDPQLLTQAEERLQQDRNAHSGNARHDLKYYYNQLKKQQQSAADRSSSSQEDPYLLTRAEELFQQDKNRHSGFAEHSFDYYYQMLLEGKFQ